MDAKHVLPIKRWMTVCNSFVLEIRIIINKDATEAIKTKVMDAGPTILKFVSSRSIDEFISNDIINNTRDYFYSLFISKNKKIYIMSRWNNKIFFIIIIVDAHNSYVVSLF